MSVPISINIIATIPTLNGVLVVGTLLGAASGSAGGDTVDAADFGLSSIDHVQLGPVPVIDVHAVYHPTSYKIQYFLEDSGGIQIETLDNDDNTTPFIVYGKA